MISRIQRLSYELAWICLGQLMVVAGGILGVRLLTYKISPAVYGDLAIGMTAAILAQQIIFVPLGQSFLRYFASAHETGRLTVYIQALKYLLKKAAVIIFTVALMVIAGLFLSRQIKWTWLFSLAFLYSLFSGCNTVLDCIQGAARQRMVVALHQGIGQWLDFLVPVGLIILWGAYSWMAMLGYVVAAAMILSSQLWFFRKKIVALASGLDRELPVNDRNQYAQTILVYAWPLALWGIFSWAQLVSSRWALLAFAGAKEVGFYSVLFQFGYYPIIIVSGLAQQLLTPVLFNRAGSGQDLTRVVNTIKLNNLLIIVAIIITIILVGFSCLYHQEFFSLVVAPEYRSVSILLPLLVLSGGLLAIGQMISMAFFIKANTQILIYPKIITASLGVLLNYLGAYFYGLAGVVVAGVVFPLAYLVWVLIIYFFTKRSTSLTGVDPGYN